MAHSRGYPPLPRPLPPPPPKKPDFNPPGQGVRPGMVFVHDAGILEPVKFALTKCGYCGRHGYDGKSCEGCGAQVVSNWPTDAFIWDYNPVPPPPKPTPTPTTPPSDWVWYGLWVGGVVSLLYQMLAGGG